MFHDDRAVCRDETLHDSYAGGSFAFQRLCLCCDAESAFHRGTGRLCALDTLDAALHGGYDGHGDLGACPYHLAPFLVDHGETSCHDACRDLGRGRFSLAHDARVCGDRVPLDGSGDCCHGCDAHGVDFGGLFHQSLPHWPPPASRALAMPSFCISTVPEVSTQRAIGPFQELHEAKSRHQRSLGRQEHTKCSREYFVEPVSRYSVFGGFSHGTNALSFLVQHTTNCTW